MYNFVVLLAYEVAIGAEYLMMVIVRISGGLGNQMFQYAAGKACALRNQCELKVDLSTYDRPPRGQEAARKFELPILLGEVPVATAADREIINRFNQNKAYKAYNRIRKLVGLEPAYTYCQERVPMHFDPTILTSNGKLLYIDGDWQNEKYFCEITDILRHSFLPKDIQSDRRNFELSQRMATAESISLHVRRGDYLDNKVHKPCSLTYYQAAIIKMQKQVTNPHFYVFSDDIAWARENLRFGSAHSSFVDHNTGANSYKDLFLMSRCQHHIVANSSFSWWGAWLNPSNRKLVIAPEEWLTFLSVKATDVVPESWVIM